MDVRSILRLAFSEFKWGRDMLVATCIAIASTFLQVVGGLASSVNRKWLWISIVSPYVVILAGHVSWRIGKAFVQIRKEANDLAILFRQSSSLASLAVHKQDDISIKLLRVQLITCHPFADLANDLTRAMGDDSHKTECDFLFEVFMANKTQTPITIQKVVAEAQIDNAWIPLTQKTDLGDYQIKFDNQLVDNPSWVGGQSPKEGDLTPNLAENLNNSTLLFGIQHRGWLRFGIEISSKYLNGVSLPYRVSLVDALDGVHPVLSDGSLLTDGEIIYNPRVWRERLRH